jgi:hypothetical protein
MVKAKTKAKNPTVAEGFTTMSKTLKTEVMGLIEKGLKKVEKGLSTLEKEVHKLKVGDKKVKPAVTKSKKAVSNKKVDAIEPASSIKATTKKGIKKSVKASKGSKK